MHKFRFVILAVIAIMAASCGNGRRDFSVDVSGIRPEVSVERFDLHFDTIQPGNFYTALPFMMEKYGDFLDFYLREVITLPSVEEADFQGAYEHFVAWCTVNSVCRDVEKAFPAGDDLGLLFEEGFSHFRYYFPNDSLPKIYTVISGFRESLFPSEGLVAIALDKYQGVDYPKYSGMFQNYMHRRMTREMMPVDYFRTYAMLNYPKGADNADNLLSEMIYQGRIQYFLKSMMPSAPDSLLWGYSHVNYLWAEAYEANVWNYLIDKKLLFKNDSRLISELTGVGPFTNAFGNESAPGVASFCGFGIVCSFMDNNPGTTLADLMQITDLQDIYNRARYNP